MIPYHVIHDITAAMYLFIIQEIKEKERKRKKKEIKS